MLDPSFVSCAVDLLSLIGAVQARAMLGGHGLYIDVCSGAKASSMGSWPVAAI